MKAKTSILLAFFALTLVTAACGSAATTLPAPKTAGTVAFAKVVGKANADIYVVNTDGTRLGPLTQTPDREEDPSWSPEGSRILYAAYPPGNLYVGTASVWVMNADGSEKAQLSKGYGFGPAWSPDGKQIVYVAPVGGSASSNTPVVTAVPFRQRGFSAGKRVTSSESIASPQAPCFRQREGSLFPLPLGRSEGFPHTQQGDALPH
jgi:hypothetical protein